MIDRVERVNRKGEIWGEINSEKVRSYKKELSKTLKKLEKNSWEFERLFFLDREAVGRFISTIRDEIKLCDFYFEYLKKSKNKDFEKWIFIKKGSETRDWEDKCDRWEFRNGKVKANIRINRGEKSVKISLDWKNDSQFLTFIEGYREEVESKTLRAEKSIEEEIERLKKVAEEHINSELIFPKYCQEKREFDLIKKLLHIEEENFKEDIEK